MRDAYIGEVRVEVQIHKTFNAVVPDIIVQPNNNQEMNNQTLHNKDVDIKPIIVEPQEKG